MDRKRIYSGSREQFEFEETLTEVDVLEDILPMDFHVLKIGPLLKGEIVQIPRWIANVLGQHGLVSIKDPGELDIAQVMKAFWKEKDNPTLQEIDPFFYTKIQARILRLHKKLITVSNPVLERELSDLKKTREQFIDERGVKMLKILGRRTMRHEKEKRFSQEEKSLYKSLIRQLKEWEDGLSRIGE